MESCWNVFNHYLNIAIQTFVPVHYAAHNFPKLLGRTSKVLRQLYKAKLHFWKKYRFTQEQTDKDRYKKFTKLCATAVKRTQSYTEQNLISTKNLGNFYRYVNKKLSSHSSINSIATSKNNLTSNPSEIANIFNDYFASVFTVDDGKDPNFKDRTSELLEKISFTPDVVLSVLKGLKSSCSSGPDGIPNIILKRCAHGLVAPLCHIFDMSLKMRRLPTTWKIACISPIHKKGPTSCPSNYRPISLTSTCCRVIEKVITKNILTYVLVHAQPHLPSPAWISKAQIYLYKPA